MKENCVWKNYMKELNAITTYERNVYMKEK